MSRLPVAIITGASRGIGKACATGLSDNGYRVVLVSRTEAALKEVAAEIRIDHMQQPDQAPEVYPLDVTDEKKVDQMVADIAERFGRIDLLVNNAGIYIDGSLDMSVEEFDRLYHANLRAPFSLMKAVIPVMKKQRSGSIFNIASRSGKYGFAKSGGYVSSKFGLVGLSESLYREWIQQGITVTAICPGWVDTEMAREAGTPLRDSEMIQAEDIVKTILWVLDLSPGACVREIVLESPKSIL